MNPTGSPGSTEALSNYFDQISVDERVKDKFHSETMNFLNLNVQIALAGAAGGALSTAPLLGAAWEGTRVGSIFPYVLATRVGAGLTGGIVNATSQVIQGKTKSLGVRFTYF